MKTIGVTDLRANFAKACRRVNRERIKLKVTHGGVGVVVLLHPDEAPKTKSRKLGVAEARASLNDLWEGIQASGEHAVITFHGKPRAVMAPYVEPSEPEAA